MPLYLSPYIGAGVHGNPFRPQGLNEPGASAIDIRLDPTRADGGGIPYALLWLPSGIPDPKGAEKLADDYGESVSALIKTLSNTKLGLDFSRDSTIQDIVETILLRPDTEGWKSLRPTKGVYECWLGSGSGKRDWIGLPAIAGGAITDSFTRSNETPLASPWTRLTGGSGNINLSSNAITSSAEGEKFYYYSNAGGWNADQTSQFLLSTEATNNDWGPAVRIGASGFSGYLYGQFTSSREIAKFVSGSYSSVEVASGDSSTGNDYQITIVGSTIRYYDAGVQNANSPATDTSLSTAGNGAGIFAYDSGGSYDNFSATGEIASGGTNPKGPLGNPFFGPFGGPI